jgi:hypothetical protein
MKIAVISYSLTGNNEALASGVAGELPAEHIKIKEPKQRTTGSIFLDLIFHKTPKVEPSPAILENYDQVIFIGPVWIGQVATPLRAYLKYLSLHPRRYSFASISGGSLGANPNPKLGAELKKRTGMEPSALADLHIAELLPSDPKPDMKSTSSYRLTDKDRQKLTGIIVKAIREAKMT